MDHWYATIPPKAIRLIPMMKNAMRNRIRLPVNLAKPNKPKTPQKPYVGNDITGSIPPVCAC